MFKIKNQNNLYSGIIFLAISLVFLTGSRAYDLGSSSDMGPGYFPTMFASAMLVVAVMIIVRSLKWK